MVLQWRPFHGTNKTLFPFILYIMVPFCVSVWTSFAPFLPFRWQADSGPMTTFANMLDPDQARHIKVPNCFTLLW